jgi:NTP pyrophosphatase (non-canonical NTP hydrolase)
MGHETWDATAAALAGISAWVDEYNFGLDPVALTWMRIAKIGEEFGEVVTAFVDVTNANPRKRSMLAVADVRKELLDVAVTALCVVEHLDGNQGEALDDLVGHVRHLATRAGLQDAVTANDGKGRS